MYLQLIKEATTTQTAPEQEWYIALMPAWKSSKDQFSITSLIYIPEVKSWPCFALQSVSKQFMHLAKTLARKQSRLSFDILVRQQTLGGHFQQSSNPAAEPIAPAAGLHWYLPGTSEKPRHWANWLTSSVTVAGWNGVGAYVTAQYGVTCRQNHLLQRDPVIVNSFRISNQVLASPPYYSLDFNDSF